MPVRLPVPTHDLELVGDVDGPGQRHVGSVLIEHDGAARSLLLEDPDDDVEEFDNAGVVIQPFTPAGLVILPGVFRPDAVSLVAGAEHLVSGRPRGWIERRGIDASALVGRTLIDLQLRLVASLRPAT